MSQKRPSKQTKIRKVQAGRKQFYHRRLLTSDALSASPSLRLIDSSCCSTRQHVYETAEVSTIIHSKLFAFTRRGLRSGLCSTDLPSISDLFHTADTQLLHNILANPNHVLYGLLPPASCTTKYYILLTSVHKRQ